MRRWAAASFAVLFFASFASAQYFGKNKVRYDSFAWKEYATPHFRISFYDRVEPSLPKIASFAESAYDELARRFNYQVTDPIPLIAFATHAEFEQTNVIVEFIPEGVGAFAVPARNRMVLPVDLPDVELENLIAHELTHIFQYEILYQGKLGKALTSNPPHWFMEGMASYMADDEDARAKAVMRDAVLSDRVPSVGSQVGGYFSYRFGNKVFRFIEAEWGVDGVRDFIFEFRTTTSVNKALDRAFGIDLEDFDSRFRAWLRKYYEEEGAGRGDPREFGPAFREPEQGARTYQVSPVASPSGDLVAAFATYKEDVDVVLYGVPDRRLYRNLTRGNTTTYQYLVAQMLTLGPDRGRDLAFSPDGGTIAVFARRERGRVLLLLDALKGGIAKEFAITVDQAMSPAYSPDGKTIAFHAYAGGRADIYLLDLASGAVRNFTDDAAYDAAPVFTPAGDRIVYSSQAGEEAKLFEASLADPSQRRQLTFGAGDDEGASFSRDGKRLYFASDRSGGIFDLYALNLEDQALTRLTNVIGAALNPIEVPTRDGDRVVYQAYSKGRWWLYLTDPAEGEPVEEKEEPPQPVGEREAYVPPVSVTITEEKIKPVKSHKLFADDIQVLVGFDEDQTLISQTYLSFADHYGDRRVIAVLESVSEYTNFRLTYANLGKRLQWGATVFDDRAYYTTVDQYQGNSERIERAYRITGGAGFVSYPLSLYHRVEGTVGFVSQNVDYPVYTMFGPMYQSVSDQIPFVQAGIVGDTTFWKEYGPHGGRRWSLTLTEAFDLEDGGSYSHGFVFEGRQYVPLSRRNELAIRLYAAMADGNQPQIYYFGGLDTLRGVSYNSLAGNRAAYLNLEWRLPLVDYLIFPWLQVGGIRGRFFLDVGTAYFDIPGAPDYTFMKDGRLVDAISSYGFGFSADVFGLPMHWDFAKLWDFKDTYAGGVRTYFWIGYKY